MLIHVFCLKKKKKLLQFSFVEDEFLWFFGIQQLRYFGAKLSFEECTFLRVTEDKTFFLIILARVRDVFFAIGAPFYSIPV